MNIKDFFIQIIKYFEKNKWVSLFFLFAIILGATNIFGFGKEPAYKSWEISSFAFTLGYTIVFYVFFFKNGYFENLGGEKTFAIAGAVFVLLIINVIISKEYIDVFNFTPSRTIMLLLLFIFALIFSVVNWSLHKHFETKAKETGITVAMKDKYDKLSTDFRSSVFTSDLPLSVAFLILTVYCYFYNHRSNMEYFFSGAVAFQMMYSNAVWIFNDDKVFEKLEN